MIGKTILKILMLGIFLAFTGCATTGGKDATTGDKYWVTVSVPEESGQVLTKITGKEDLVDTTAPFAVSKDVRVPKVRLLY